MLYYKSRTKSKELKILTLLDKRMKLNSKDKQHYLSLNKGYEGEVLFDTFTKNLTCECLILNDLLFEVNNTFFQIDSLIMMQRKIHFFEVKNFAGDYYYQSDKLFKKPKLEVINPLHQLSRSESLLQQLLLNQGFNLQIDASVVFVNPDFNLYQAPLDKPIIFSNQINRYIENQNTITTKLTAKHNKLADQLLSLHKVDSPFSKLPTYDYEQLQKGITCLKCQSYSVTAEKRNCVCQRCGYEELVSKAVLRTLKEFQILFPNQQITTNIIYDWCQMVKSKQRIRRILASNYKIVGVRQWAYFV
ncbi:nuclease-related domain-containing protein [Oceanobacillus saliphilus]|uniref:nuclease-related domain-containing protein n=1 Tax=Oceanobacillus saliphilus TaxID=2925834 RepID=UPI00201DE992|nr:nuclease-related domain-containing protein [Oceanobacillus saliphilus]